MAGLGVDGGARPHATSYSEHAQTAVDGGLPRRPSGAKWGRADRLLGTAFGRTRWQAGPSPPRPPLRCLPSWGRQMKSARASDPWILREPRRHSLAARLLPDLD